MNVGAMLEATAPRARPETCSPVPEEEEASGGGAILVSDRTLACVQIIATPLIAAQDSAGTATAQPDGDPVAATTSVATIMPMFPGMVAAASWFGRPRHAW